MSRVYFFHYRMMHGAHGDTILPNGGATVAVTDCEACNYWHTSIAFCSPLDQFSKKLGRRISEGRLNALDEWIEGDREKCPRFTRCMYKADSSPRQTAAAMIRECLESLEDCPEWVRNTDGDRPMFLRGILKCPVNGAEGLVDTIEIWGVLSD